MIFFEDFLAQQTARIAALAAFLDVEIGDIRELGGSVLSCDGAQFLVLTDEEADEAFTAAVERYVENYVQPRLPSLDIPAFVEFVRASCGRGIVAEYDGHEWEIRTDDTWFIYRQS